MKWLIVWALLIPFPAVAQEAPVQERCWLAGEGFSPGATVLMGDTVMECTSEYTWSETDRPPAGCLSNGNLSATGTLIEAGPAPSNVKARCEADGTWHEIN